MEQVRDSIAAAVKELFGIDVEARLERPDEQFGEYTTNIALQIAARVGKKPLEIAEELKSSISHEAVAGVEVAGPGFINITLTDQALIEAMKLEQAQELAGKKILVEYSDPNPFKPLHAGHLYTTLVGDTVARLLENIGAEVVRINYGGDVGLHVGKSMWAIIKNLGGDYPEKLADIPEAERASWLGDRYVEGNSAYEQDETAKTEIINVNKGVYDIHARGDHDSAFARIYWTARQWSYDYFQKLYEQLQVNEFDRFIPESEVTPLGIQTVKEHTEKGVFNRSDGAIIFDGEKHGLHTRVFINSEGLPTYETKDVGLSLTKWRDYNFDQSIIITANEQAQYMQVVIKAIEQFEPEPARRTRHLTHGVVKLLGGVKMSSRLGNVVTAQQILDAAAAAGQASENKSGRETILAAVKYAFAKNRIGGDIVYDPAESIALEGNSGPYLQYAHARARSILAKSESKEFSIPDNASLQKDERGLVRKIGLYPETVQLAAAELMPHHVCTYLYELAQEFNRFYEKNRVIGDEREQLRLGLVSAYAKTLKQGLELLGINAPNKL